MARVKIIAVHQGLVESIMDDRAVIRFSTKDGTFRASFPLWRLIRAGADDIGARVEHRIMTTGTQMISDLKAISPVTYVTHEEEELKELPPEVVDRINKWWEQH